METEEGERCEDPEDGSSHTGQRSKMLRDDFAAASRVWPTTIGPAGRALRRPADEALPAPVGSEKNRVRDSGDDRQFID
ncbi:MAG TPA: hypothetical protein VL742_03555 [Casimicrobiaceae bacterium]|nr:hypothetical protein [Casimicrobiaceae bacterium]